jgi:crotonobetainyl-CoA:carnitine CoA-transferase CaiB-like acyl-CoA transferase
MGDFITAQHLVMGINFALFHFRKSGKGQIVSANFLRSGMFGSMI